jgi:hypothetical protein
MEALFTDHLFPMDTLPKEDWKEGSERLQID